MASVASLMLQSKSLNLLTSKCSQNIPEAPRTASCKVAQRKMSSPSPLFLLDNTFKSKNRLLLPPFYGCCNHVSCITTVSECYRLSFILQLCFCRLFKNCLLYFFYAYNRNYRNAIEPFLSILIADFTLDFCLRYRLNWRIVGVVKARCVPWESQHIPPPEERSNQMSSKDRTD